MAENEKSESRVEGSTPADPGGPAPAAPNAQAAINSAPVIPQQQLADAATGRGEYGGVRGHESQQKGVDAARQSAAKEAGHKG